jgi:hypothetical protein
MKAVFLLPLFVYIRLGTIPALPFYRLHDYNTATQNRNHLDGM